MYEIVNEELGIKACGIADLTEEQKEAFLRQWEEGAKLSTLTLFCERKTGDLVLNSDNESYKDYLAIAEEYMSASAKVRTKSRKSCPKSLEETLDVMDRCLKIRESIAIRKRMLKSVEKVDCGNYGLKVSEVAELARMCDNNFLNGSYILFKLGFLKGQRAERQKIKRQSANA